MMYATKDVIAAGRVQEYPQAASRADLDSINSRLDALYQNLQDCRSMIGRAADRIFGDQLLKEGETESGGEPSTTEALIRRLEQTVERLRQQANRF